MLRSILFYVKFFLKGGYINDLRRLKFSRTSWIGKSVSIFFEKPGGDHQMIILGEGVKIGHFSDLAVGYNNRIWIKDHTTINTHCKIAGDVTIERYCLLSANILISSGAHYSTRYPHLLIRQQDARVLSDEAGKIEHSKPVHIEEDVWIGFGVYIKQGVTVGRGAVIGANSVVLKDIPPYEIHGGSPARKLKNRLEFKPKTHLSGSAEEDRPYFYRGFDHFQTNGPEEGDLRSFSQSTVAIPFITTQIIVCKGYLIVNGPISLKINIDFVPAGEYEIKEKSFELRIQITDSQYLKRAVSNYSFLNFEAPNAIGPCFSIKSIDIISSL